jgi:hypothetical protein
MCNSNYPSLPKSRSHYSTNDPRNKPLNHPKQTHQTHNGNLHDLLSVPHRSDWWFSPVRPVDTAGQAGGNSKRTETFQEASVTPMPWNKNHHQNTNGRERETFTNSSKAPWILPRTNQEHHSPKPHEPSSSPEPKPTEGSTGQTSRGLGARDEQRTAGQAFKITFPISRFAPRIRTRLWGLMGIQ